MELEKLIVLETKQPMLLTGYTVHGNLDYNFHQLDDYFKNDLKYKKIAQTYGVHSLASREHYHVYTLWDVSGCKCLKTLDKPFHKYKKTLNLAKQIKISLSFCYNKVAYRSNPKHNFRIFAMAYAYKEYASFNEIDIEKQFNLSDQAMEELREYSNAMFTDACNKRKKEEDKKKEQETKKQQLYEHLDIKTQYMNYETLLMSVKIRDIVRETLIYKKINNDSFRLNDLKNQAVNYLYNRGKVSEDDIIEMLGLNYNF